MSMVSMYMWYVSRVFMYEVCVSRVFMYRVYVAKVSMYTIIYMLWLLNLANLEWLVLLPVGINDLHSILV